MPPRERNDRGRYADGIPPEDVLEVFDDREDRAEPVTAGDVAEELGIARRTAHNKLNRLVERGELGTKKVGARGRVYWRPIREDREKATPSADTPPEPSPSSDPPTDQEHEPAGDTRPSPPREPASLEDVDFPAGRDREACEAAVYAARDHLAKHGPATMRELVLALIRDHPLGYDVDGALAKVEAGERYRGAWWRKVVKPGLEALEDVEAPVRGASEWTYIDYD